MDKLFSASKAFSTISKALTFTSLVAVSILADVAPPVGWGDFQMGVVNNKRTHWDTPMRAALDAGVEFDRRYTYVTAASEVMGGFLFPEGWGEYYTQEQYFKDKGVKPTMTVYMLQKGADGLDAVISGCADQAHMKEYFDALIHMVQKSVGSQPIYVLEPDVWGYLVQNYESEYGATNIAKTCHINNHGYEHLAEFSNTIQDIPKAIIKTIKLYDPDAYTGILMAHWGYEVDHTAVISMNDEQLQRSAQGAAQFLNSILGDTYRGDFMGVEKNGADAGWYVAQKGEDKSNPGNSRYWTDQNNANWVQWTKYLAQEVELPLLGWQICLGHEGLPNTNNQYEDTFFEYFFDNVPSFIDAGFIGIMAGCNNRDEGTTAEYASTSGDGGWFYDQMGSFNAARPYLSETTESLTEGDIFQQARTFSFNSIDQTLTLQELHLSEPVNLYSMDGRQVESYFAVGTHSLSHLPQGQYIASSGRRAMRIVIK